MASNSGENAKLAEDQEIDVYGLIVAGEVGVAGGAFGVAFDVKDHVFFMFETAGVLESDQELSGIVMDGHLLGSGGAPNSEIAEGSFLAGEGLFLGD